MWSIAYTARVIPILPIRIGANVDVTVTMLYISHNTGVGLGEIRRHSYDKK